jgi:hypothetical protein
LPAGKNRKRKTPRQRKDPLRIVSFGGGFLLTIGPVSLLLDRPTAEEIMCLLADALEPDDPILPSVTSPGSN